MAKPFLTARWENLLLLNYCCPSELLRPLVPPGTELDSWNGTNLSLVGFNFLDTRVAGLAVPGHRSFEEVNLRFYVRRSVSDGPRRGVVFVRELVPRRLIAAVARLVYNEPYMALPMSHEVDLDESSGGSVSYSWVHHRATHSLTAHVTGTPKPPAPGSEAEFITEHYWGYNRQRNSETLEYRVDHPRWSVWECDRAQYVRPAASSLYGAALAEVMASEPASAFLAPGSAIEVFRGRRLSTV